MKKLLALSLSLVVMMPAQALAHQPVALTNSDISAKAGPLLVDGTVSFAIRASFSKPGERKGFRAALKAGDLFSVQYLIEDQRPVNTLKRNQLPKLTITSPTGKKINMKFDERTPFFEPYGGITYIYLARLSSVAEAGIYEFLLQSRKKAAVTIAVGDREVMGEVSRGNVPAPTPTSAAPVLPVGYTAQQVAANNQATKCWSIIDGNVYDLTSWIGSHPGGSRAIISLCGVDGTASFLAKHAGSPNPKARLSGLILGPLTK